MTDLDNFETALLDQLRTQVGQRRPSRRDPRRLMALGAAAAAAAVAAVVFVPGVGTSPAYSVQEGNAGEVKVTIHRPEDAAGLERALEEHGIPADITYLPDLQTCASGRYTAVDRPTPGLRGSFGDTQVSLTIPPGTVRDGETFVLVWSAVPMTDEEIAQENTSNPGGPTTTEGTHMTVRFDVVTGPVKPCTPAPMEQ